MKHSLTIIIGFLIYTTHGLGQTVNFTDLELKRYLINEMCVDTTQNGLAFSNDRSVDTNNDLEIQLTEALAVEALELNDFPDSYAIKSLLDLNEFSNLTYLKIIDNDSLEEVADLRLDSLNTLWISDGLSLNKIDISNLPNITTTLRIEGVTTLDTLNIQNGTSADQFSLFYSQNIKYACIDSISNEIDEFTVTGAMLPGESPSFNCEIALGFEEMSDYKNQIKIYLHPANNHIIVKSELPDIRLRFLTITGKEVLNSTDKMIDVSMLPSGLYFIRCIVGDILITKKIIIR